MIYIMQRGDICVVEIEQPWSKWFLARIVEHEQDRNDNWQINKVQVVGEKFERDDASFGCCFRISDLDKHKAAQHLAIAQWGEIKGYDTLDAIKAAILAAC
jgi:hypothetical protein